MSERIRSPLAAVVLLVALVAPPSVRAAEVEPLGFERTPPRLSYLDGEVSFFRPGAADWSVAEVNTPLAAGDELYAGAGADLEVQIGPRGYLRAGEQTQIALASLEPDFLQLRVSEGNVSLDLRTLVAGQTFEIDAPNAAFTIERSGYYRIEVAADTTTLVTRRGGRASVTSVSGFAATVTSSEQVVISGLGSPKIETYAAPELDPWDRWNYARTDRQMEAVSARYVSPGVYGIDDLDHYGDWRVVPTYGAIWVPRGVAGGWAPYTAGRWIHDPYYGWTWLDVAPWGWAPYHHGRWVQVSRYWAWAPGPIVVRSYYAPALVAFFGGGGVSVGVSVGRPHVGWLALGWGEPIIPWWGPRGFRGVPRWGGWGGPRVVNRLVIERKTVVRAGQIRKYENERVRHAFVAVERERFGRGRVQESRLTSAEVRGHSRIGGDLDVRPARESLAPSSRAGQRPPRAWQERAVVATREPRRAPLPELDVERRSGAEAGRAPRVADGPAGAPRVRLVEPPRRSAEQRSLERPPFGARGGDERAAPPPAPRYRQAREREAAPRATKPAPEPRRRKSTASQTQQAPRSENAASQTRQAPRRQAAAPRVQEAPRRQRAAPQAPAAAGRRVQPREAGARERARDLPGEPANRVYRPRQQDSRPGAPAPSVRTPGMSRSDAGSPARPSRSSSGGGQARRSPSGTRDRPR